tara:strand:+ start:299 stop:871 length:573 start_codon:yes stop_codon:yes gene_type:complete
MARTLNANAISAITADEVRIAFLVKLRFSSTVTLNLWTGSADKQIGGTTYTAAGNLLSIASVDENSDLGASGLRIVLSGCNAQIVEYARDLKYQGQEATVYMAFLDAAGDVTSSFVYFRGTNDTITYRADGDSVEATLVVENELLRFGKSRVRRYTLEDQKEAFPADPYVDKGFKYVHAIAQKEVKWGSE